MSVTAVSPGAAGAEGPGATALRALRTFSTAAASIAAVMLLLTLFCQWKGSAMGRAFTADPKVTGVGTGYLRRVDLKALRP